MTTLIRVALYCGMLMCLLAMATVEKRSKRLYLVVLFFIWITVAFSMDSYDISNYRYAYDNFLSHGKEPLYDWIKLFFAKAGVPFGVFKLLYGTVLAVILYKGLKLYTDYAAFAAALFAIIPMLGMATQMRNSMAGAIMIYGTHYLLRAGRKNVWRFGALLTVAVLFHFSVLFYALFLIPILMHMNEETYSKCVLCAVLGASFVLVLFSSNLYEWLFAIKDTLQITSVRVLISRTYSYFDPAIRLNLKGFLFLTCHHVLMFVLVEWACLKMKRYGCDEQRIYDDYAISVVRKINATVLMIVPFYMVGGGHFGRIFNYCLPLFYGVILQGVGTVRRKSGNRESCGLILALLTACTLFVFVVGNLWDAGGFHELQRILNGFAVPVF